MSRFRRYFSKNKASHRFSKRRRSSGAPPEAPVPEVPEVSGDPGPVASESRGSLADAPEARKSARHDRTAEFRLPQVGLPPSAPDEFEIQVRRVQGHWISKVRATDGRGGSRLFAGLGDSVAKSLLELARHLDSDLALEDLDEPSSGARHPRRARSH